MRQSCGCCNGIQLATPQTVYNRPGLSGLQYRVGTYATFFETMLARLHNMAVEVETESGVVSNAYSLKGLTTRELDDPAIALLDAWAVVADVLTFYEERIANEGYLSTATERRSALELARLIGYKLRPGVAASVYLAFSVSDGFSGILPAGTRAQSVPGAGETAQFFETEEPLEAKWEWNAVKPRLTRPQIVTPPPTVAGVNNHLGTNADVVEALFLKGVSTNVKTGDALLISFGDAAEQQFLRTAQQVEIEGEEDRTRVVLERSRAADAAIADVLTQFIADAGTRFEGSDLAAQASAALKDLMLAGDKGTLTQLAAQSILPLIRTLQSVAVKRGFLRLEPWFEHIAQVLGDFPGATISPARRRSRAASVPVQPVLPNYAGSSLSQLASLVDPLSKPASVQPRNAFALMRSVGSTFTPQSDIVPRLLTALRPVRGSSVYQAWRSSEPGPIQLEIYALRSRMALFASSYAGAATYAAGDGTTSFTPPALNTAWAQLLLVDDPRGGPRATSLSVIALDAVNDKIQRGSWIAVERPTVEATTTPADLTRSFHRVTRSRTMGMGGNSATGFSGKVTVLDLETPWLQAQNTDLFQKLLESVALLRETSVYAQAELVELAEEPLDRDVQGGSVELDGLYDGLLPGKWVIVTGKRTDIPNVTGLSGSELAMIAEVTQGKGKTSCRPFLAEQIPFRELLYISDADSNGDRLVVGRPGTGLAELLAKIGDPEFENQEFCEHVQLCPGLYVDAYVPTAAERGGDFSPFAKQLVNPDGDRSGEFSNGVLPPGAINKLFAWRIRNVASGAETVHTTLEFANPLACTYDSTSLSIMANVAKATHGQTTGEVLGDGGASQAFQTFALRQIPLTYVSADTVDGIRSTLQVTVNEIGWDEAPNLYSAGPVDHSYITRTDDDGKVTIVFGDGEHGARVPTGSSNVKATYRYGIGKSGNVKSGAISQLATHPLGAQGVTNPMEASGGADGDTLDQARRNAPTAVLALDRLVSVQDYADFSRTFAGIGKARSTRISDGRRQIVQLTIAGAEDIPIDLNSELYRNLVAALGIYGDPGQPVQVDVRRVKLLVISAGVQLQPKYAWDAVAPRIREALEQMFSFDARDLGQAAYLSEAISAMQRVEGVSYVDVKVFDAIPEDTSVQDLTTLAATLGLHGFIAADAGHMDLIAGQIKPAELVFLNPDLPETLILSQIGA